MIKELFNPYLVMEQLFQELYFFRFVCKDFYQVKIKVDFPLRLQLRKNSIRCLFIMPKGIDDLESIRVKIVKTLSRC